MKYQELADLDSTPDQDKALTIEWVNFLNGLTPEQLQTAPKTTGEFLARWVKERLLDDVVNQRLARVQVEKLTDAVRAALDKKDSVTLRAMAAAAHVDIDVPIPRATQLPNPLQEELPEAPRHGIVERVKSWFGIKE